MTKPTDGYEFFLRTHTWQRVAAICVIDGDKCLKARNRTKERKGGSGFGIGMADVSFTLNCSDRHGVAVFRRRGA